MMRERRRGDRQLLADFVHDHPLGMCREQQPQDAESRFRTERGEHIRVAMDVLRRGRRHYSVFLLLSKYRCQATLMRKCGTRMKRLWLVLVASLAAVAAVAARPETDSRPLTETFVDWTEHPAIRYLSEPATDPVAELN